MRSIVFDGSTYGMADQKKFFILFEKNNKEVTWIFPLPSRH